MNVESLNLVLLAHWDTFERQSARNASIKAINGRNLDIATVLIAARYATGKSIYLNTLRFFLDTMALSAFQMMLGKQSVLVPQHSKSG